jgi:putative SOS response-associated peptidase YedK
MPVIINDNEKVIDVFKWGLIPQWIKSKEEADKIRINTLNARSESIFEKPSFRTAIQTQRCLIPATGFYEWQHQGKSKIPYFIELADKSTFAFGGIFSNWINKETGEIIQTFSIITTDANPLMAEIHNSKKRMPLILEKENEDMWLQGALSKTDIMELLVPFNENKMSAIQLT